MESERVLAERDFTSIQERIRAWHKETMTTASVPREKTQDMKPDSFGKNMPMSENAGEGADAIRESISAMSRPFA